MRKALALILVLIFSLSVITACQVDNEESDTSSPSDNSSAVSETSEANSSEDSYGESKDESVADESSDDTNDESEELSMSEFFTSTKYMQLQDRAFNFISAYERADYDDALELVADSEVLESNFPTEGKSLDDMVVYHITNVVLNDNEEDGETATLLIAVGFDDESTYDFSIDMEFVEETFTIEEQEFTQMVWKVTSFTLNP